MHRRKSKEQTYFAKKMLTYHEANRVGEHVARTWVFRTFGLQR